MDRTFSICYHQQLFGHTKTCCVTLPVTFCAPMLKQSKMTRLLLYCSLVLVCGSQTSIVPRVSSILSLRCGMTLKHGETFACVTMGIALFVLDCLEGRIVSLFQIPFLTKMGSPNKPPRRSLCKVSSSARFPQLLR